MSPDLIDLVVSGASENAATGLITSVLALVFKWMFDRSNKKRAKEKEASDALLAKIQNEREKEQLESANEREQLKNGMQEIRKDQGLIEVFSKVVEGIGRMDRSIRETSQAYTSALEQNTQSINKIDESVTMSNGKVENQYEVIAETLESINDVLGTIKVSDEKQHEKLDGVIKDLNRISDKLETMSETEQATLTVDKSAVVQTVSNIDLNSVQTATPADNDNDDKKDNKV